jgi:uncharacterized protein
MSDANFRTAIADYIQSNANPPDKFSHQPRLYSLARSLADAGAFDDDVLFAAAWLHDIGVFIGHRPESPEALAKWDNVAYAIEKVPGLLRQFGFPPEKIPAVIEVVRTHLPSGQPNSFEAVLLRDADILEQLGAVGILRNVSKTGRDTRYARFSEILKVLRRNLNELPPQLRLQSARNAATARVELLQRFLAAADAESCGIEL